MARPLLVLIMVALVAAGCTQPSSGPQQVPQAPEPTPPPVDMTGFESPFVVDHDHSIAALHRYAWHARQTSHHPLGGSIAKASGAHVVDVKGDWLFVGAWGNNVDADGGLWIFDVSKPETPRLVSVLRLPGAVGGDRSVEATHDGEWVVLGTEAIDCGNHVNPFLPGLYLIDVRNKLLPRISDYRPTLGIHTVAVHHDGEQDLIVTLGGGPNILTIDRAQGKFVGLGSVGVAHDSLMVEDPVLNTTLLYVADVSQLSIYDMADPTNPREIGHWERAPDGTYVHSVAVAWIEGRRIVFTESEDWGKKPSPLWVLDATDIEAPELIATWVNPDRRAANAGQEGSSLAFSTHNLRYDAGRLILSHYHGGVWVFNVSTLQQAIDLPLLGYYVPHEENGGYVPRSGSGPAPIPASIGGCYGGFQSHELPLVHDAESKGHVIYAADQHTGLYSIVIDASAPPLRPQT